MEFIGKRKTQTMKKKKNHQKFISSIFFFEKKKKEFIVPIVQYRIIKYCSKISKKTSIK